MYLKLVNIIYSAVVCLSSFYPPNCTILWEEVSSRRREIRGGRVLFVPVMAKITWWNEGCVQL